MLELAPPSRVRRAAPTLRILTAVPLCDGHLGTIRRDYARPLTPDSTLRGDRALARAITQQEAAPTNMRKHRALRANPSRTFVIGVAGPGGVGKSTLIDELTSRFLRAFPQRRLAVLANDPSHPDSGGAVLGDRVSAIYAQDDRVFFRSLATRGNLAGLSAAAPGAISVLRASGEFDLMFVESVGIGQESDPFHTLGGGPPLVDATLFVLAPHYGGRVQLQKIALLNGADWVALNKCDDPQASTAKAEILSRLRANRPEPVLHETIASQHFDSGGDRLFAAILRLARGEDAGGERPCQLHVNE